MAIGFPRARSFVVLVLLSAGPLAAALSGLQGPSRTGVIVGKTIDGSTGEAIGGATVSIVLAAPPAGAIRADDAPIEPAVPTRVISDSNGRFMFHGLAGAGYSVTAIKPGYIDAAFGRRSATDVGSQPLELHDGERRGNVSLSLWKRATLGGTVLDEAGEPVIGLQLRILKRAIVGGMTRFTALGNHPTTDDRGVYRISELTPGDYVVGVVTTQTAVPDSLQEAYASAAKTGAQQDFQREIDRSRGILGGSIGGLSSGQWVGAWMLQAPMGIGSSSGDIATPPIRDGKVFIYPTVFYPSAPSPSSATLITLGPGDERTTVDFEIKPVVTSRVSGVLLGPDGPERHTSLDLTPISFDQLQRDYDFATASTVTDANGTFVFLGVPPGAYTIRSLKIPPRPIAPTSFSSVIQTGTTTVYSGGGVATPAPIPAEPTLWVSMPVAVGERDVTDLALTLRTGVRLSGRIEFQGSAKPPTTERLMQMSVQVENADARTTSSNQLTLRRGVVDATGNFKTYQLPEGRYVIRGAALPNWTFKGAFLNGRDVSDLPLELESEDISGIVVTYSDRPTEFTGTARRNKEPDGAATILVFPAQPNYWTNHGTLPRRFKTVRARPDGVFRITSVPAGDYIVVGVHGGFPSEWQDPAYLKKLMPLGTRTTIADGEIKSLDVATREIR